MIEDFPNSEEAILLVKIRDEAVGLLIRKGGDIRVATLESAIEAGKRDQSIVADRKLQVLQVRLPRACFLELGKPFIEPYGALILSDVVNDRVCVLVDQR